MKKELILNLLNLSNNYNLIGIKEEENAEVLRIKEIAEDNLGVVKSSRMFAVIRRKSLTIYSNPNFCKRERIALGFL